MPRSDRSTWFCLAPGLALVALGLGACRSQPAASLPAGPGLVTRDRTPPVGAETFDVPQWLAGDRYVYRKAGVARLPLRVTEDQSGALQLEDEETGRVLFVGPAGLERGQRAPAGEQGFELDPGDDTLSWPLWVGKRWTSQFVSRAAGRGDLPLIANYHCDASELVTVPAGTFECLRIWRRARLAAEGEYPERSAILWYAPEVGAFARRLDDGLLTELMEFQRQR